MSQASARSISRFLVVGSRRRVSMAGWGVVARVAGRPGRRVVVSCMVFSVVGFVVWVWTVYTV
jgi:hypothetical protein